MLFLSWDLKYTGLVTNSGPVPFIPWGTSRESRGEVKTIHNEKASTLHETLEVGVKDAVNIPNKRTNFHRADEEKFMIFINRLNTRINKQTM